RRGKNALESCPQVLPRSPRTLFEKSHVTRSNSSPLRKRSLAPTQPIALLLDESRLRILHRVIVIEGYVYSVDPSHNATSRSIRPSRPSRLHTGQSLRRVASMALTSPAKPR